MRTAMPRRKFNPVRNNVSAACGRHTTLADADREYQGVFADSKRLPSKETASIRGNGLGSYRRGAIGLHQESTGTMINFSFLFASIN